MNTTHNRLPDVRPSPTPPEPPTRSAWTPPSALQARWLRIREFLHSRRSLFATQGTIVASWREQHGRRWGPYYRLAYREAGRQRSLYLGATLELAQAVRQTLAEFQCLLREKQVFTRLHRAARAALRASTFRVREQLAAIGIRLKGSEFRGVRAAFARGLRPLADFTVRILPQPPPTFIPPVPPSLRHWFWKPDSG